MFLSGVSLQISEGPPSLSELERCYQTHGERFSLPALDSRLSALREIESASKDLSVLLKVAHGAAAERGAAEERLSMAAAGNLRVLSLFSPDSKGAAAPADSAPFVCAACERKVLASAGETQGAPFGKTAEAETPSASLPPQQNTPAKNALLPSASSAPPAQCDGRSEQQQQEATDVRLEEPLPPEEAKGQRRASKTEATQQQPSEAPAKDRAAAATSFYRRPVNRRELQFDWQLRSLAARLQQQPEGEETASPQSSQRSSRQTEDALSRLPEYSHTFVLLEQVCSLLLRRRADKLDRLLNLVRSQQARAADCGESRESEDEDPEEAQKATADGIKSLANQDVKSESAEVERPREEGVSRQSQEAGPPVYRRHTCEAVLKAGAALREVYERQQKQELVLLRGWSVVFSRLLRLPPGTPPNPHVLSRGSAPSKASSD